MKTYYIVVNQHGLALKDPEFCRKDEKPFETYCEINFTPKLYKYREQAEMQIYLCNKFTNNTHHLEKVIIDITGACSAD